MIIWNDASCYPFLRVVNVCFVVFINPRHMLRTILVLGLCMCYESTYRLDAEAKGSTGFRILKTHIKSRGRQPEGFMTRLKNSKSVDPIG